LYYRNLIQFIKLKALNTKEFIVALAEKLDVSHKEAAKLLEHTTRVLRETVVEEKKLTILHLGSFQVKKTASRSAYIPALNKKALVPPKSSIHFHPAETLKDKLKKTAQP
jgi:nucleoid DNA-binding protein